MAISGTSPHLFQHINDLTREIEELKRTMRKEEEIRKGLEESIKKKSDTISTLQEKSKELDKTVKHNHSVYVSQKQAVEKLECNIALLREQLDAKKADLQKRKEDAIKFKSRCDSKLNESKETFQEYMEIYKKLPGVQEYLDTKNRLEELQVLLKTKTDKYAATVKLHQEQQKIIDAQKNKMFPSLAAWGVALAEKYKEHIRHRQKLLELSAEVEERKKSVKELEKVAEQKEKERAAALERQQQELRNKELEAKQAEAAMNSLSSKISGSNAVCGKLVMKSPKHGLSVPNIPIKIANKSWKQYMPSIQFSRESSLTRSKSLGSLAKGSSGSGLKPSATFAPTSLQKWLKTQKKQIPKERVEPMDHSGTSARTETSQHNALSSRPNSSSVEKKIIASPKCITSRSPEMTAATVTAPYTATPPKTPVQPATSSEAFNLQNIFASPEDDFKFSLHVIPETPAESTKKNIPNFLTTPPSPSGDFQGMFSPSRAAPDYTPTSQEFKFAVPSGPAPSRSARVGLGKSGANRSKLDTSNTELFTSPFSLPKISDQSSENESKSLFSLDITDSQQGGSGFSLFGNHAADDSGPSNFTMFKDDSGEDETSEFQGLFSLGFHAQ